jgi:DNA-binding NarL/FixJ family response regulator
MNAVIDRSARGISWLSPRELDILQLAADGVRTPQMSEWLNISYATARTHKQNILRKLNCHTMTAADAMGFREGRLT